MLHKRVTTETLSNSETKIWHWTMRVASFRQLAIEACQIYAFEPDGVPRLRKAAFRAHLRRDFHNFWA